MSSAASKNLALDHSLEAQSHFNSVKRGFVFTPWESTHQPCNLENVNTGNTWV